MTSELYRHPKYYEIAFGFMDVRKQIDLFEAFIEQYSGAKVRAVLDICCGPALQLREFSRRGYEAIGLDNSSEMLNYLENAVAGKHLSLRIINADMLNFHLDQPVDFAYILMGSLPYAGSNKGMVSHLLAMANALKPGGLYLVENLPIDWANPENWEPQTWDMKEDGVKIRTTYHLEVLDPLEQIVRQTVDMRVDDNGRKQRITNCDELKYYFPQEFRAIVEMHGQFEFLGFFEKTSNRPLHVISSDNIALLRKK